MYFKNRAEAGKKLAQQLSGYRPDNIAVVALSEGALIVGAQIAMQLHGSLSLLLTRNIFLPGENDPIAAITSSGTFTKNQLFSAGQLEELLIDYHTLVDERRRQQMHDMNQLVDHDGEVKKEYLRRHVVILASDGLSNGFSIDVAYDFLKTVAIKKLIVATPVASVQAVDKMHLLSDEIVCLDVKPNYISTNHYYDDNTIPSRDGMGQVMRQIAVNWAIRPI